jgi:hypothetical protein
VPPTGVPGAMPSGDVAEIDGVGITSVVCAKAGTVNSGQAAAMIKSRFMISSAEAVDCRATEGALP